MSLWRPLEDFGHRIIVLGPTNSGKSTLAAAIADKLDIPAVHLDQLRHLPNTDWVQRDDAAFAELHAAAVATPAWVMDGSYSKLMPQRLARATGIVVIDEALAVRYWRYLRRTFGCRPRAGALPGNRDSVKWEMLRWLWVTRNKADGTRAWAAQTGLPTAFCHNQRELADLYSWWGLPPPYPITGMKKAATSQRDRLRT